MGEFQPTRLEGPRCPLQKQLRYRVDIPGRDERGRPPIPDIVDPALLSRVSSTSSAPRSVWCKSRKVLGATEGGVVRISGPSLDNVPATFLFYPIVGNLGSQRRKRPADREIITLRCRVISSLTYLQTGGRNRFTWFCFPRAVRRPQDRSTGSDGLRLSRLIATCFNERYYMATKKTILHIMCG